MTHVQLREEHLSAYISVHARTKKGLQQKCCCLRNLSVRQANIQIKKRKVADAKIIDENRLCFSCVTTLYCALSAIKLHFKIRRSVGISFILGAALWLQLDARSSHRLLSTGRPVEGKLVNIP